MQQEARDEYPDDRHPGYLTTPDSQKIQEGRREGQVKGNTCRKGIGIPEEDRAEDDDRTGNHYQQGEPYGEGPIRLVRE